MVDLGYLSFDGDNHYYEPRDAFTRHIEPKHRDKAVRVVRDGTGRESILVGDKPFTFLADMELNFDLTLKPGSLRDYLRYLTGENAGGDDGVKEPVQPAYINRDARLALMDHQRLESSLLFPTLGVCVEHFMKDDVEQSYANLRAFNRWLDEDWGFDYRGRIFAAPIMSLLDADEAVKDIEWAISRGARIIGMRPGPQGGKSPADPAFDAFWSRVNEAKLAVAFHVSESGYNEMMSVHWGENPNPSSHSQSAFQWCNFYGDRPIMDTISALIFHNLFGRYPNIRVLSVENGSLWVPYIIKAMDKMKGMGRNGPWIGGRWHGRPSEVFRKHIYVSPYHEEDIVALGNLIGMDRVVFGSDYPHPEGLCDPVDFAHGLEKLGPAEQKMIMRDNQRRLVGLDS
ncbi:MAG TPA: amidohydrolase family protein [Candidatus Binatia bacterium]|nr:amidohydrolase family protein [Candidatus Binatia bacterium]